LLGSGKGFERGVMEGFPRVSNFIYIWNGGKTQIPYQGLPIGRDIQFTPADVDAIRKDVPSVGRIEGQNSVGMWGGSPPYAVHKSKNGVFSVAGAFAHIEDIESMKIIDGRSINELDTTERRKVVLIGKRVRDQLFVKGEPVLGENITINGINFQVIGVSESLQQGNQQQEDEKVYIPNDTLRYAFNQTGFVGSFMIIPKPGIHAKIVEEDVKRFIAQRKKISPDDKGVFGSFNLQDESDKVDGLFIGIKAFSWIIAIGTIFAGAVGVGNIMLIVVKERTREIGLRKALGATPGSITMMIMQESLFITAVAGYIGLIVGALLLETISNALESSGEKVNFFSHPEMDFKTAIVAMVVLVVAGVLASLMPAKRAASVNPITALQDE
jgi:putative ABC transport system permease protein